MAGMEEARFRQDMPPKGGYAPIYIHRTFPRIGSRTGRKVCLFSAAIMSVGYFWYRGAAYARTRWFLEENDTHMVAGSFMMAERDRLWLNMMRDIRERERELMKDVPGWRVGTFYGEPIYYTLPPDSWWDVTHDEVTAVSHPYHIWKWNYWRMDADIRGGEHWYDKYLPFFLADK